jgi:hypothetical protein
MLHDGEQAVDGDPRRDSIEQVVGPDSIVTPKDGDALFDPVNCQASCITCNSTQANKARARRRRTRNTQYRPR